MNKLNNETIVHNVCNTIEIIQFKRLLEYPNLVHGYTLKKHGINFSRKPENMEILQNSYRRIKKVLDEILIIHPHQMHTNNVKVVNFEDEELEDVDGVITNKKDLLLCTTSADCISLLFYDDNKKVIGDVHSGWRGTVKKISKKAVEKMIQEYDCNPKDIICCICPSIRKCHFEVEEDVMKIFKNEFEYTGKIDEIISTGRKVENKQKYNIDTVLINKILLEDIGLQPQNIIDCGICTVCNFDDFHSYRVEKENFGINGAFIGMKWNSSIIKNSKC